MSNWVRGMPLTLESENFLIRSLTPADATDEYISWWNDKEVQESLGFNPRGWTRDHAVRHILNFDNRKRLHLGIFPKGKALPIGFISILTKTKGCVQTNVVIGNKSYWGKRVPIEVRTRVLEFLFEDFGVHKVCGEVDARNFASIFNYKAHGFTCEGVFREHKQWVDGTWHDELHFGLLRSEWLARKNEASV